MWSLGLIVFGTHLFVLGYLVLQSGFIPKVFGGLLSRFVNSFSNSA